MFKIDATTLLALFGTSQGLVFAAIFWLKNKNISNKLFSIFLLVTSIRIFKNVFVHLRQLNPELFPSFELWRISVYMGISHQLAIGPLFLLYFQSRLSSEFKWKSAYLVHFIPYFVFIAISPVVQWGFWMNGGLWFCYLSILIYFLLAFRHFYYKKSEVDVGITTWLRGLLLVSVVLMVAYSPALFHYIGYAGSGLLYSAAILTTGYIMLTSKGNGSFFRTKYETSSLSTTESVRIKANLEECMVKERPFLNPELSLKMLAALIKTQPHHLSRVINQEFNRSFADYINSFRLKEAEKRLKDPQYDHLKISALAYECGFNSVPTLNTLFKKVHKKTPSTFRADFRKNQ
ncbi:MAG: helix-turn-helix transcriptional regulator [Cyclobacteriaceae bacterium]